MRCTFNMIDRSKYMKQLPSIFYWSRHVIETILARTNDVVLSNILLRGIAIILLLLLLGGRSVTKLQLVGPLYLIDTLFLVLVIFSLIVSRLRVITPLFFITFIIIFFMLMLSIYKSDASLEIVIRQFALFIYAFSAYVLSGYLFSLSKENELTDLLVGIAALSVIFQTVYLAYLFLVGDYVYGGFNYLSPLVICGVIVWTCYIFSMRKISFLIIPEWIFLLMLSITFGHSSGVMAVILIPLICLMLRTPVNYRLYVLLTLSALVIFVFWLFPEIIDVNASWRLVYWETAINRIFTDWYWLFGFGFGAMYADDITHYIFLDIFNSSNDLNNEGEGYLKAFHNSFVTIFFHVGIIGLVLLLPQIRAVLLNINHYSSKENMFFALSLLGLSIWVFFNVVLELPHSAHYFWLFFFLCYHSQCKGNA